MKNNELSMVVRGSEKVLKTLVTAKGNDKSFATTTPGILLITKEAIRLSKIMSDNKAKRKPNWYKFINVDNMASALYLLGSKCTLHNKDIKWKRHTIIDNMAKELFDYDLSLALVFTEWLITESSLFTRTSYIANNKSIVKYVLDETISEGIINQINKKAAEAFYPLPMTVKPLDWFMKDGNAVGGYESKQYPLVRKVNNVNFITDDLFLAINTLQAVPYRINNVALEANKAALKEPIKSEHVNIEYPDTLESQESKDQVREYYRQVNAFKSLQGKYRATKLSIEIADNYKNEERIYFPCNFDYRGRMYPIPVFLQPQGDDIVKSMLEFADGVTLTEQGAEYAYYTLAGLYGEDKESYASRVNIGKTVIYNDYMEADEPYQFLALQTQMLKWEEDNSTLIYTPGHLDGSCNGLTL